MNLAGVVVNPTKLADPDGFMAAVEGCLRQQGWRPPLWLETTADDPGRGQAMEAAAAGADLVLACGGDGTVTACAEGLADSGVPLGIIPLGTGNLLALNLGLPAGVKEALLVALTGCDLPTDVGLVNGARFVVMAGLGLDARMLADASEPLKHRIGSAAYAVSVLRHLGDRPMRVRVSVDGGAAVAMRASAVIIGNVGWLRGGLPLLPDARPDDGKLDAVILTARGWASWAALAAHVLTRRGRPDGLRRTQFRRLQVDLDRAHRWERDGELMGTTQRLIVEAQPGGLLLRLPAPDPACTDDVDREVPPPEPAGG